MNLNLPGSTVELLGVLRRALDADGAPVSADLATMLDDLGVLDLAAASSPDPENAQLNVVSAIEELARSGRRGPFAETIWARSQGLATGAGFVTIPNASLVGGDRLLPYGMYATGLVIGHAGSGRVALEVVPMPVDIRPAHIEVDEGHCWAALGADVSAFADLDAPYAWRCAAAAAVGYMSRASDMAVEHARTREQFGKPLGSFQAIQFRLAETHWRLLGLRLLVREAAWRADRGDPRAEAVSALAWLYARDVGRIITKHAHQVFGAIGFTHELGLTALTGATAAARAMYAARPAADVVRQARFLPEGQPPSTILGGFATAVFS
jgi:Acyl-CoA dehydrogenase, C-terminal domain